MAGAYLEAVPERWEETLTEYPDGVYADGESEVMRSSLLRRYCELVTELGGDPYALVEKCGIDTSALDDSCQTIRYAALISLLELSASALNCPDFGMRLGVMQTQSGLASTLGPLDVAMRNAPSVGAAFRYCADHVYAFSPATRICFDKLPGEDRSFLMFEIIAKPESQQRQAIEHALVIIQRTFMAISGGKVRAREIWLPHDPQASKSSYWTHFNAPISFGQSVCGLFFDSADLEHPVPGRDAVLFERATHFIDHRVPSRKRTLSMRVRVVISRLLADGRASHEHIAEVLGLHPRTLQRRLREEGASFEEIKDQVRREVALRCLRNSKLSLVRVTEILGYSETSVLSRSCHRWFSASPSQLRGRLSNSL